jgi:hypothetical protein
MYDEMKKDRPQKLFLQRYDEIDQAQQSPERPVSLGCSKLIVSASSSRLEQANLVVGERIDSVPNHDLMFR